MSNFEQQEAILRHWPLRQYAAALSASLTRKEVPLNIAVADVLVVMQAFVALHSQGNTRHELEELRHAFQHLTENGRQSRIKLSSLKAFSGSVLDRKPSIDVLEALLDLLTESAALSVTPYGASESSATHLTKSPSTGRGRYASGSRGLTASALERDLFSELRFFVFRDRPASDDQFLRSRWGPLQHQVHQHLQQRLHELLLAHLNNTVACPRFPSSPNEQSVRSWIASLLQCSFGQRRVTRWAVPVDVKGWMQAHSWTSCSKRARQQHNKQDYP